MLPAPQPGRGTGELRIDAKRPSTGPCRRRADRPYRRSTPVAWVSVQPAAQGAPLSVKTVGAALLVVQVPWNPAEALAPGLMMASHDALVMVTAWPSWRMPETPQPLPLTVWPAGRVRVSVQPL